MLLVRRDAPETHHVLDQKIGPSRSPYAQKLNLGWVIVGETCLGNVHSKQNVNVKKTNLFDGRRSTLSPCTDKFDVSYPGEPPAVFAESELAESLKELRVKRLRPEWQAWYDWYEPVEVSTAHSPAAGPASRRGTPAAGPAS